MKQCDKCDETGWHHRQGNGWQSYFPHGAMIKVDTIENNSMEEAKAELLQFLGYWYAKHFSSRILPTTEMLEFVDRIAEKEVHTRPNVKGGGPSPS